MPTIKDVRKAAKRLGAKVEDDRTGNVHECRVEAPQGKIWAEGDVHELVDVSNKPWKPDYENVLSRMSYGLIDCPQGENCEWCHEND